MLISTEDDVHVCITKVASFCHLPCKLEFVLTVDGHAKLHVLDEEVETAEYFEQLASSMFHLVLRRHALDKCLYAAEDCLVVHAAEGKARASLALTTCPPGYVRALDCNLGARLGGKGETHQLLITLPNPQAPDQPYTTAVELIHDAKGRLFARPPQNEDDGRFLWDVKQLLSNLALSDGADRTRTPDPRKLITGENSEHSKKRKVDETAAGGEANVGDTEGQSQGNRVSEPPARIGGALFDAVYGVEKGLTSSELNVAWFLADSTRQSQSQSQTAAGNLVSRRQFPKYLAVPEKQKKHFDEAVEAWSQEQDTSGWQLGFLPDYSAGYTAVDDKYDPLAGIRFLMMIRSDSPDSTEKQTKMKHWTGSKWEVLSNLSQFFNSCMVKHSNRGWECVICVNETGTVVSNPFKRSATETPS
mmetsp:Transcript_15037/g.32594  ORF Transcript_15037/g.32594 Transcript_15037/m.32594 type:complete len:417 (+) Transcript_15037:173-1423(+)